MCHGDVGMVTYRWGNTSRKPQAAATAHQCIDWDSLAEWTNERTIDMFKPGFLVHPTKGKWGAFAIPLLILQLRTNALSFPVIGPAYLEGEGKDLME